MSDLRPKLGDQPTEAEKILLRSAQLDVPPPSGKGRALAAAALAATITTTAGTGGAAATVTVGVVAKWIALGAVGGAVVFGAAKELRPAVHDARRGPPPGAAAPAVVTMPASARDRLRSQAPASSPATEPERRPADSNDDAPGGLGVSNALLQGPRSAGPTRQLAPDPFVHAPTQHLSATPPPDVSRATERTLAEEVSTLDAARRALASGDADGALRSLDQYDDRIARRRLGSEATLLRIEALVALGRWERARYLAERFLAAEPDGAYAKRVHSLVAGAPP